MRDLLNRLIDERLVEQEAVRARVAVLPAEIDAAVENIAGAARLDVHALLAEARMQGLSEQEYRDELRRHVLEGKLVNLRVRGRVHITEQDARAAYAQAVRQVPTGGAPPPTFLEVRERMFERALETAIDRERSRWLLDLRRGVPIDVRL